MPILYSAAQTGAWDALWDRRSGGKDHFALYIALTLSGAN
jgi:hypothetical protein